MVGSAKDICDRMPYSTEVKIYKNKNF